MGDIVFVTGGERSGKSRFAEQRAAFTKEAVTYIAVQASDDELSIPTERYRGHRPADWRTVEEPIAIARALIEVRESDTVLLDSLSLCVSNKLLSGTDDAKARDTAAWDKLVDACVAAANEVIEVQAMRKGRLIVVTNEIGLGVVPADGFSRFYSDALGLVNEAFARAASEAYLLVSGLPLKLK